MRGKLRGIKKAFRTLAWKIEELIYDFSHVIAGFLCGILSTHAPLFSVLGSVIFILYELDEDYYLNDQAYKDIREFLIGYFLAGLILLLHL